MSWRIRRANAPNFSQNHVVENDAGGELGGFHKTAEGWKVYLRRSIELNYTALTKEAAVGYVRGVENTLRLVLE